VILLVGRPMSIGQGDGDDDDDDDDDDAKVGVVRRRLGR